MPSGRRRVLLDVLSGGRADVTKAMTAQEQEQERKLLNLAAINTKVRGGPLTATRSRRASPTSGASAKGAAGIRGVPDKSVRAHPELSAARRAKPVTA